MREVEKIWPGTAYGRVAKNTNAPCKSTFSLFLSIFLRRVHSTIFPFQTYILFETRLWCDRTNNTTTITDAEVNGKRQEDGGVSSNTTFSRSPS